MDELEAKAKALAAELGIDYTPAALEVDASRRRAIARARALGSSSLSPGAEVIAVCPRCAAVIPPPDGAARIILAEWGHQAVTVTDAEGRYWPIRHTCTLAARLLATLRGRTR